MKYINFPHSTRIFGAPENILEYCKLWILKFRGLAGREKFNGKTTWVFKFKNEALKEKFLTSLDSYEEWSQ